VEIHSTSAPDPRRWIGLFAAKSAPFLCVVDFFVLIPEISGVVETSSDRGQVLGSEGDVRRASFEDRAPFVLLQRPPGFRLADRDEDRGRGARPTQAGLNRDEPIVFGSLGVAFVTANAA